MMVNLLRIITEVRKEIPPVLDYGNMPRERVLAIESQDIQQFVGECMRRYKQECRAKRWKKSYVGKFCNYIRSLSK